MKESQEALDQEDLRRLKEDERKKREAAESVDVQIEEDPDPNSKETEPRLLRNQFNFSDRASQTFNATLKERGISTEPPPTSRYSNCVTQWAVYDR